MSPATDSCERYTIRVNGAERCVAAAPETPLLLVLRNDLGLTSAKYGCGAEQCGACMVLIDGQPAPTCRLPLRAAGGRTIVTAEGLADGDALHPIQEAFIEHNAIQCGYCAGGLMIAAAALLEREPAPTREQIRTALDRNICRCGAHNRMIRATEHAAAVREESAP
jgi:nicotinate dehydrogenase subunit A